MVKTDLVLQHYLERHAESEARQLSGFPLDRRFTRAVVIPAFNESPAFLHRLRNGPASQQPLLCLLVINQPDHFFDTLINTSLLGVASDSGPTVWRRGNLLLIDWPGSPSRLLVVDRFTEDRRIPRSQGVGLARKIGCDIAVALRAMGVLQGDWIHNTDADTLLPPDYFEQTDSLSHCSAAVYRFRHRCQPDAIGRAHRLYERSLHYYVEGLAWAGSPYAYHSIGSCIAHSLPHYCQARGFPRRAGGEDFYLLNKLAKLAPVVQLQGEAIQIQARESSRVPIGTGPAVNKIVLMSSPEREYLSYDPIIFSHLKGCLHELSRLWSYRDDLASWREQLPDTVKTALAKLDIDDLLNHLPAQAKSERQFRLQTHYWFDGFRTLKFIHWLQQSHFSAVPLAEGVAQFERMRGKTLANRRDTIG